MGYGLVKVGNNSKVKLDVSIRNFRVTGKSITKKARISMWSSLWLSLFFNFWFKAFSSMLSSALASPTLQQVRMTLEFLGSLFGEVKEENIQDYFCDARCLLALICYSSWNKNISELEVSNGHFWEPWDGMVFFHENHWHWWIFDGFATLWPSPLTTFLLTDHWTRWFFNGFGVIQPSPFNDFQPPNHCFKWFFDGL